MTLTESLIEVTKEHIDNGFPGQCSRCPVSVAIKELTKPWVLVTVSDEYITMASKKLVHAETNPTKVVTFIRKYDLGNRVRAFKFWLAIPTSFLRVS